MEYNKLREEKLMENKMKMEEKLHKISEQSVGQEIPMDTFVTQVSAGREMNDIYLKHPGNESSEDEEGAEEKIVSNADEEQEEQNFKSFMDRHKQQQEENLTTRVEEEK